MLLLNSVGRDLTVRRDILAGDIKVTVDGTQTKVVSVSLSSGPRRIVLMVDTSGSMNLSPQRSGWGIALRTAAFAYTAIPSDASVALVTFGDKEQGVSDGFQDSPKVGRRMLNLAKQEPSGRTALFDSIDQALSLFQVPQLGDAIYLVTDGGDNKSHFSIGKLKEKLAVHGVRVFVFLVPIDGVMTVEEAEGQSQMGELAQYTGGYVIRAPWNEITTNNEAWLTRLATQIRSQLQEMYQIELDIPSVEGSKGRVKVGSAGRKLDNNTLAYPRQLVPCTPVP
jgi:Ca-activated chloride channel family protein